MIFAIFFSLILYPNSSMCIYLHICAKADMQPREWYIEIKLKFVTCVNVLVLAGYIRVPFIKENYIGEKHLFWLCSAFRLVSYHELSPFFLGLGIKLELGSNLLNFKIFLSKLCFVIVVVMKDVNKKHLMFWIKIKVWRMVLKYAAAITCTADYFGTDLPGGTETRDTKFYIIYALSNSLCLSPYKNIYNEWTKNYPGSVVQFGIKI